MINVIGIGQNRENMTLGAIKAIEESDVIVGYKKYINQIEDLIEDKEIVKKGMGDEIQRAEFAIQKSLEGQTVSLISSGDPGVFGMANVLYQIVSKYEDVEIKVYPGVSALNYASSYLGAPLNDFAAISLSNILTPLSEIEKKLKYALKADLIIAIYNPLSKTRKEPFRLFKQLVGEIKGENALIGIVDSSDEANVKTTIVEVKDLSEDLVNMSCTLIVGNDLTYIQDNKLVTPRGYVIRSKIHPLSHNHYDKFLNGEIAHGPNRECEFYPCHFEGQYCDFCYCPFYPCGDSSTGGQWIKGKDVWNCKECTWLHEKQTVECLRKPLEDILEDVEDLKTKKKMLLKLRRACILKNNPKVI